MADAGGGDSNEVLIKVRYELSELQKGQAKLTQEFEKTKKKAEKAFGGKKAIKELSAAVKELTTALKAQGTAFDRTEKGKQKELQKTNKEIDLQKKKLQEVGKFAQSRTGRFLTSFAAGAGVGGLRQPLTAERVGGFAGRMLSRGIGGVAGFAMTGLSNAYQSYLQYGQAVGGLVGLGRPGQMKAGRAGAHGASGARLGYSMIETAQQAAGVGRATRNIGAVYKAQQAARATGMDVGEVTGYMGMIRQAGHGFGGMATGPGGQQQQVGQSGPKMLEKVIAAGMLSGIEKARLPEYLQGLSNITQAAAARTSGKVDIEKIASFQTLLGKSGLAGFQGARGAAVTQQLMQSTVTPGGGEAGQSMMLQALGFGKPGGKTSYYSALKNQQQGMERPENVAAMFKEVYSQLGVVGKGGSGKNQEEANLALSEMTGLSIKQIEDLGEILNSGKSSEEQMKSIKKQMEKAEPIDKQALREMKSGFGGVVQHLAGISDMTTAIGGKVAPYMMKMSIWQLKALNWIANQIPDVVDWLKELYLEFRVFIDKSLFKGDFLSTNVDDAQKEMIKRDSMLKEIFGEEGQKSAMGQYKFRQRQLASAEQGLGSMREALQKDTSQGLTSGEWGRWEGMRQAARNRGAGFSESIDIAKEKYSAFTEGRRQATLGPLEADVEKKKKLVAEARSKLSEEEKFKTATKEQTGTALYTGTEELSKNTAALEKLAKKLEEQKPGKGHHGRATPKSKDNPGGPGAH